MDRPVYRPKEAARLIGVSHSKFEKMLASGEIRSFKAVGCRFITAQAITEWVDRHTQPAALRELRAQIIVDEILDRAFSPQQEAPPVIDGASGV